jgi:hypothetical protein
VSLVRKVADEIRITIFFKSFGVKKINELVVTNKKVTDNYVGLVTSGLGQDVAYGPPVGYPIRNNRLCSYSSCFAIHDWTHLYRPVALHIFLPDPVTVVVIVLRN